MKKPTTTANKPLIKKIAVDALGVLCIIGAILFGWIPGPGGIPLLLAGLGLLASNHEWARKLLNNLKNNGLKIGNIIFNEHPLIVLLYDTLAIGIIIVVAIYWSKVSGNIMQGLLVALFFVAIGLLLGNKKRMSRLNNFVKKQLRKT